MKMPIKSILSASILAGLLAVQFPASADQPRTNAVITTFDNFTSDALYPGWNSATINSTLTSYVITATGYGSNYKYIGFPAINGTGCTNVQLDVYLSGPAGADGQLGPIVNLIDADGTEYSYRWYGQTLGQHTLNMAVQSPTVVVAAGSTPGLDLNNLQHMHMSLDPGGFGNSGAYTISWNDLRLTGGVTDPAAQNVTQFVNFALNASWASFASATIVTNTQGYQLTTSGWGGGYKGLATAINASANTNIELTVTLGGPPQAEGQLGPIVRLVDGNGTALDYAWYGQTVGTHVLTLPLSAGVPVTQGQPAFNFASVTGFQLQLDPGGFGGTYTVAFQDLDFTGSVPGPIIITAQSYNPATRDFTLTWTSSPGKTYSVLGATSLNGSFSSLATGIASGGASTTTTVTMPVANTGFLRVQQE